MAISDAEILDTVRKLRTYMANFDNCHVALDRVAKADESHIGKTVGGVLDELVTTSKKVSVTLKYIENTPEYRRMLKNFNMKDVPDEEEW